LLLVFSRLSSFALNMVGLDLVLLNFGYTLFRLGTFVIELDFVKFQLG